MKSASTQQKHSYSVLVETVQRLTHMLDGLHIDLRSPLLLGLTLYPPMASRMIAIINNKGAKGLEEIRSNYYSRNYHYS